MIDMIVVSCWVVLCRVGAGRIHLGRVVHSKSESTVHICRSLVIIIIISNIIVFGFVKDG